MILGILSLVAVERSLFATSLANRAVSFLSDKGTRRILSRVSYDGSSFSGFQVQPQARTVQGELEKALSQCFEKCPRIVGAGRTDKDVHSGGQAFNFDLPKESSSDLIWGKKEEIESQLNAALPNDIRIWNISDAPPP